jgi:hypothetical protein
MHVGCCPDGTISLWANETWHAPFGIIHIAADAKRALMFPFLLLLGGNVTLGHEIRLCVIIGLGAGLEFNVEIAFGVATNTA